MATRRKWIFILIGAIVVLITVRATLPYFVTRYANRVLQDMREYAGSVADVDMSLYRGAYTIDNLEVFKINGNTQIPFIAIPKMELGVQWGALLDGALVGKMVLHQPTLNFINKEQAGEKVDWVKQAKELFPIRINRFEIINGTVKYYDFTTKPNVDLQLQDLQMVATNFANVEDPQKTEGEAGEALPAEVHATAVSVGGGKLNMDMRLNPLQQVPDLDMNLRFEGASMPAFNDFFRAYAGVDLEQGTLSVYSEVAVKDGQLEGYIKPVAENVEVVDLEEDNNNVISLIWQGIVGFVAEILENQKKEQLATQVPLRGDLNNVETSVWTAIWNIFSNGFVQAFSKSTNDTIRFKDMEQPEEGGGEGA
jgi:hypothetical protein